MSERAGSVLITGATSGIGRATATLLAQGGSRGLILTGRDPARLDAVVAACRAAGCADVHGVPADLADTSAVRNLARYAAGFAPLAGVVNSAGFGVFGALRDTASGDVMRMFQVNAVAPLMLCRELLDALIAGDSRPMIVNISSDADSTGFAGAAGYCASKGAMLAMSRALREDLRKYGIRLCTISPGRVDTNFNGKSPGMRPGALTAEQVAEVVAFCLGCDPNIDLQEIRLDSISRLS